MPVIEAIAIVFKGVPAKPDIKMNPWAGPYEAEWGDVSVGGC